jgi:hypothetical protein
MDRWAWEHLDPWLELRTHPPVGALFCVLRGSISPTQRLPRRLSGRPFGACENTHAIVCQRANPEALLRKSRAGAGARALR